MIASLLVKKKLEEESVIYPTPLLNIPFLPKNPSTALIQLPHRRHPYQQHTHLSMVEPFFPPGSNEYLNLYIASIQTTKYGIHTWKPPRKLISRQSAIQFIALLVRLCTLIFALKSCGSNMILFYTEKLNYGRAIRPSKFTVIF